MDLPENLIEELKKKFLKDENLFSFLKSLDIGLSEEQIINLSYDIQAGSYIKRLEKQENLEALSEQCINLAKALDELEFRTILDAGTGEATTLALVLNSLKREIDQIESQIINGLLSYRFNYSMVRIIFVTLNYLKIIVIKNSLNIFTIRKC